MARESGAGESEATGDDPAWIRPRLGRADDMRAEVWLQCDPAGVPGAGERSRTDPDPGPFTLTGTLTGPSCSLAATLPTTSPLVDQGPVEGRLPLARAICTEPGFWTPELPCLYRAEVELRRGGRLVASGRRSVGLRRCGTRGGSIRLDGRRYVPRGVAFRGGVAELSSLRSLHAAAVVGRERPDAVLSSAADRSGVAIVARLVFSDGLVHDVPRAAAAIGEWALHPSTLLAVLPVGLPAEQVAAVARASLQCRGTLLLALAVDGVAAPPPVPAGIDLIVVELSAGRLPHEDWRSGAAVPLVACEVGAAPDPERARSACDALQARLAAWGHVPGGPPPLDWAGYLSV